MIRIAQYIPISKFDGGFPILRWMGRGVNRKLVASANGCFMVVGPKYLTQPIRAPRKKRV